MSKSGSPHIIQSISELHQLFALSPPRHPLISVINFEQLSFEHSDVWKHFANDFFCITLKNGTNGKLKYGQQDYAFKQGSITFTKPRQVFSVKETNHDPVTGYMLLFHAELLRSYPLAQSINTYGFFSYSIAEALYLSEEEELVISSLLREIQNELEKKVDNYTLNIIVSHIDLLVNYADRFYNRQFHASKTVNNDLLVQLEEILNHHFNTQNPVTKELLTVHSIASRLNLSPDYLSDLLRHTTGQNARQYIQYHLIEKAKELLSTTGLGISEISYRLGFEYSQSFSKLFKKNTGKTPLEYRQSFT